MVLPPAPADLPAPAGRHAELCLLPATRLAAMLRERILSSVELTHCFLERIADLDPLLSAYVTVLAEQALEAAREADRRLQRCAEARGLLEGVPVAVKDLFDFKRGAPNSFGSLPLRDYTPDRDSPSVMRLERAGAVVLGKTNTSEFGHKAATDNRLVGPTSSPLAPGCNAGGSSGGSAAAVAAGLAACATGSDGAGSLRVPAAFCGVFAFKPTHGLVPSAGRPNAFRSERPRASVGPLARTVADAALMMRVLVGFDARDPLSVPPPALDWAEACDRPIEGLRVAFSPDLGGWPVEPEVRAAAAQAAFALEREGAHVQTVDVSLGCAAHELDGMLRRLLGLLLTDVLASFAQAGVDLLGKHRDEISPEIIELVEDVHGLPAVAERRDDRLRTAVHDSLEDIFDSHDVLACPTVAVPPFANANAGDQTVGPSSVAGESVDPLFGWCLTAAFNLTGHPAASVPVGRQVGPPVGLQIAAGRHADATVLAVSAAVQRLRDGG